MIMLSSTSTPQRTGQEAEGGGDREAGSGTLRRRESRVCRGARKGQHMSCEKMRAARCDDVLCELRALWLGLADVVKKKHEATLEYPL